MIKYDSPDEEYPLLTSLVKGKATFYTSDSRQAAEDGIFVALKGAQSDGHFYLDQIKNSKLSAVVVAESAVKDSPQIVDGFGNTDIVVVKDTALAHRHLAHEFRKKSNAIVVAVGGSAGKTTTKDFIFDLVSPYKKSFKTVASQNGHLGIPKTFEQLRPEHEVAIIEIGIDNIGDMQRHVELVEPDFAVLTSIGEEHLNLLKNIDTVFAEERKLIDWVLKRNRLAFVPLCDEWLAKINEHPKLFKSPAHVSDLFSHLDSPFFGDHINQNLALATMVAHHVGLSDSDLKAVLQNLKVPEGRGRIEKTKNGAWLVGDYYNSNPDSLRAGLLAFSANPDFQSLKKHLIIGDMFDLGNATERAHESVVDSINRIKADTVILVGKEMSRLQNQIHASFVESFSSTEEAVKGLDKISMSGAIFLKASRGMYFEKIQNALLR